MTEEGKVQPAFPSRHKKTSTFGLRLHGYYFTSGRNKLAGPRNTGPPYFR